MPLEPTLIEKQTLAAEILAYSKVYDYTRSAIGGDAVESFVRRMLNDLGLSINDQTVRPTKDRVLIRRDNPATHTAANVEIPEDSRETPNSGTVVAVGEDLAAEDPPRIRPGDRVVIGEFAGTETPNPLGGPPLLIVSYDAVCAILD